MQAQRDELMEEAVKLREALDLGQARAAAQGAAVQASRSANQPPELQVRRRRSCGLSCMCLVGCCQVQGLQGHETRPPQSHLCSSVKGP